MKKQILKEMKKKGKHEEETIETVESKETSQAEEAVEAEVVEVDSSILEKEKKYAELLDRHQRLMADFDNFKRRTLKEKESLYQDAVADTVSQFLVVLDNLERAAASVDENTDTKAVLNGVQMVLKQFGETFTKVGVAPFQSVGETFDPTMHNAVMHVEDDSVGESVVVEEFQKGYKLGEKVIRYSMVKVAN